MSGGLLPPSAGKHITIDPLQIRMAISHLNDPPTQGAAPVDKCQSLELVSSQGDNESDVIAAHLAQELAWARDELSRIKKRLCIAILTKS